MDPDVDDKPWQPISRGTIITKSPARRGAGALARAAGAAHDSTAEIGDEARWTLDALLTDGSAIRIRPIRSADAGGLQSLHSRLSEGSQYRRFFGVHPLLSDPEARHFASVDHADREAFVAVRDELIVGVGRYDRVGPGSAEVAFTVEDALQGSGVGNLLLQHIATAARERGYQQLIADTLVDNRSMLSVFRDSGFAETTTFDRGVVRVTLDITAPSGHPSDRGDAPRT